MSIFKAFTLQKLPEYLIAWGGPQAVFAYQVQRLTTELLFWKSLMAHASSEFYDLDLYVKVMKYHLMNIINSTKNL